MLMILRKKPIIREVHPDDDPRPTGKLLYPSRRLSAEPAVMCRRMRLLGILCALSLTILSTGRAQSAPEPGLVEAQAAVRQAEAAVQLARQHRALWTTAEQALTQAQEALSRREYAAALGAARRATTQARLGLEQTHYVDFSWLIEEAK
jgi:predicted lipoprotein